MADRHLDHDEAVDSNLCKMIAWLSVCVLAAAWGSNLDPAWRPTWRLAGAFGLASAVGLSVARRAHSSYRRHVEQKSVESLLTRRLASELFTTQASARLRPIVERFFADFEASNSSQSERRLGTDEHHYANLYRLDCSDSRGTEFNDQSIIADVRNISLHGIGLLHNDPLTAGPYVLTYITSDGARLVVGIDVSWCRSTGDGKFVSGGRFVEFSQAPAMIDEPAGELQAV